MSPVEELILAERRVQRVASELADATQALVVASRRAAGYVRADLPDVQAIVHEVAEDFGVLPVAVLGHSKLAEFAEPRKVAMYLARMLTPHGLHTLGRAFNKDHGSICNAENRVVDLMSIDATFGERVERLRRQSERRLALMRRKPANTSCATA